MLNLLIKFLPNCYLNFFDQVDVIFFLFTLVEPCQHSLCALWTRTEEPDRASSSTFFRILITSGRRGSGRVVRCKEHLITRGSAIDSSGE